MEPLLYLGIISALIFAIFWALHLQRRINQLEDSTIVDLAVTRDSIYLCTAEVRKMSEELKQLKKG